MVKFTNKHGFPKYIQKWLKHDDYDYQEGTVSATGLLSPVRAVLLKERHWDELELDVSDMVSRRYGSAIHKSFEEVKEIELTQEKRYYCEIAGHTLTGKPDMVKPLGYGKYRIIDIKSTSVWNYIYASSVEDWKLQLSIYRYILEQNDMKIDRHAEITLVFTDWKRADARRKSDYPDSRLAVMGLELFSIKFIEEFIRERLEALDEASELKDAYLPKCDDEELWKNPDKWAVMKKGRKSAVRVFDTKREAEALLRDKNKQHYIEHRKGMVNRCKYCDARSVCDQCEELTKLKLIQW